jgi:hypothetical protein
VTFLKLMPLIVALWFPASSSLRAELIDVDQWNNIGGYSLGSSAKAIFPKFGLPNDFLLYGAPIKTDRAIMPPESANARKDAKCPSGWNGEFVLSVHSFDVALQCSLGRKKFETSFASSFFGVNCNYVLPEVTIVYFPEQQTNISKVTVSFLPSLASRFEDTGLTGNNTAVDISIQKVLAGLEVGEVFDAGMRKRALLTADELRDRFGVSSEVKTEFPNEEAIWAYRIIAHNTAGSVALTVEIGTLGQKILLEKNLRLSSVEKDQLFHQTLTKIANEETFSNYPLQGTQIQRHNRPARDPVAGVM